MTKTAWDSISTQDIAGWAADQWAQVPVDKLVEFTKAQWEAVPFDKMITFTADQVKAIPLDPIKAFSKTQGEEVRTGGWGGERDGAGEEEGEKERGIAMLASREALRTADSSQRSGWE
jgi:hypothetical protein